MISDHAVREFICKNLCWLIIYMLVHYCFFLTEASDSSGTSLTGPDSVNFVGDDKAQLGM